MNTLWVFITSKSMIKIIEYTILWPLAILNVAISLLLMCAWYTWMFAMIFFATILRNKPFRNKMNLGKLSDTPCDLCGKKGNTTIAVFSTYCNLLCCPDHSQQEINDFKQTKKQEYLKQRQGELEWVTTLPENETKMITPNTPNSITDSL